MLEAHFKSADKRPSSAPDAESAGRELSDPDGILQARILVVDDEPVNVKLLEKMLQAEGYTNVHALTDPRDVKPSYQTQPFDLILLDINMPFLNGFDVMQQLAEIETESYLPILILTAQTDRETRLQALKSGAKDFLTKPLDRAEVLNRIHNMLEVRLLHNQIRDQNRLLEQKVRERTQALYDTRLEIVRRLGLAAEYRDNETGLHIIRMSKYSQIMGLEYGLSEQEAEMLLNASPMHDIGKIGIPDNILLKPGKLGPAEWETMKTHATIGAKILSGHSSPLLDMAQEIAMTHHEKWDGSGYPEGLKGDQIPLVGRIVAVADVFDALTSSRPYKEPWSFEDAIAFMKEQSGKHFDPDIIDVFLATMDEIIKVSKKYAEPDST